jgi:beta-glucanase (GH16 family)
MPRTARWSVLAVGIAVACAARPDAADAQAAKWELVWQDEFDGKEIDRTKWDFDLGNGFFDYDLNQWFGGWGNNELQYYTREPENAFVKDGHLHIRAVKEAAHGCGFTSARLKSRKRDGSPLFNKVYGKFEWRAKLPLGRGLWPALWLLPQGDAYGTWASSGEIDVLEARGQEPNKVSGAIHFGGKWPTNTVLTSDYTLPDGGTIADFHTYALEWEPGELRWYVDGAVYATRSFWWSTSRTDGKQGLRPEKEADLNPWPAPFDKPFYLVMNLAVGGNFLGNPDRTTPFPAEMLVDYVRVYDKPGGYGPPKPRGGGKLPFGK